MRWQLEADIKTTPFMLVFGLPIISVYKLGDGAHGKGAYRVTGETFNGGFPLTAAICAIYETASQPFYWASRILP